MSVIVHVGPGPDAPRGFKVSDNPEFEPDEEEVDYDSFADAAKDRAAFHTDVEQLRNEAREKSAELARQEAESAAVAAASDAEKRRIESELETAREQLATQASSLSANENSLAEVTAARDALTEQLNGTKAELAIAQKNEAGNAKIAELEQLVEQQTATLGDLTGQESALRAAIGVLDESKKRLEAQVLRLTEQLGKFKEAWANTEEFIAEEDAMIKETLKNDEFKALIKRYISESDLTTEQLREKTKEIMGTYRSAPRGPVQPPPSGGPSRRAALASQ